MRTKPPYRAAQIDRSHPLAAKLSALYPLHEGAGSVRNLVTPSQRGDLTGVVWGRSDAGAGLVAAGNASEYCQLSAAPIAFGAPFTVLVRVRLANFSIGGGGYSPSILNLYTASGAIRLGSDEGSAGSLFASGSFMAGGGRQTASGVLTIGKTHTVVVTSDATSVRIYCDGAQVDNAANAFSSGTTNVLCARDTTVGALNGTVSLVATWDGRALTAAEVQALSVNPYVLLTAGRRSPDYWLAGGGGGPTAYEGTATLAVGAGVTGSGGASTNYEGTAVLAVGAGFDAARLGTATFPTGRIVTADAFRLLTAPTDLWGGDDDPEASAGGEGDAYFKGSGGLYIKTAAGWVTYTPVWTRTGTLLEPVTAGDSVAVPGTLGVTGIGTFATHVLPLSNYVSNLGALAKKYLSLHAAELFVETLVAQNTLATIGGRILVGPTNPLTADLAAATTTITVKYNNFANGDRVYLEANGAVEWMAITSAAGGSAGAYTYSVTRNLDGSGANDWVAGDAVFSTGQTGAGYIDLYSVRSLRSDTHKGPTIVGNVRTGATYSDLAERWAIGNLRNLFGYADADLYGAAFGDPSNAWVKIDPTNGIRIGHNATTKIELTAAGVAKLIGIEAMSVILGSSGYIRQGQTAYDTGGAGFWLGDVSGTAKFSIGNSAGKKLLWDGTDLKLVASEITLGEITSDWSANGFYRFATGASYGGGANDRLGVGGVGSGTWRGLLNYNRCHPSSAGGSAYEATWEAIVAGWYNTGSRLYTDSSLKLYSGEDAIGDCGIASALDEGVLRLTNAILYTEKKIVTDAHVSASYPVLKGIQTLAIGSDQNNYSISADKYLLKVTNTSGAVRYFNGFSAAGATPEDGRILVISNCNASNQYVYLNHDNAGSTAAYRIYTRRQAALEIRQNESVTLRYDAADSRWVTIG